MRAGDDLDGLANNQVKTETEHPQEIPAYLFPPERVTSENIEGTLMKELGKEKVCANLKADPYKLCQ